MFTAGLAESEMEVVPLQGVEPDMIRYRLFHGIPFPWNLNPAKSIRKSAGIL